MMLRLHKIEGGVGMKLHVRKAEPVGDQVIPDTVVTIADAPGAGPVRFAADADALAAVLFAALPGGTIDALLAEMMRRKRTQLVVRHDIGDDRG